LFEVKVLHKQQSIFSSIRKDAKLLHKGSEGARRASLAATWGVACSDGGRDWGAHGHHLCYSLNRQAGCGIRRVWLADGTARGQAIRDGYHCPEGGRGRAAGNAPLA
jgi:hypothetical protein